MKKKNSVKNKKIFFNTYLLLSNKFYKSLEKSNKCRYILLKKIYSKIILQICDLYNEKKIFIRKLKI